MEWQIEIFTHYIHNFKCHRFLKQFCRTNKTHVSASVLSKRWCHLGPRPRKLKGNKRELFLSLLPPCVPQAVPLEVWLRNTGILLSLLVFSLRRDKKCREVTSKILPAALMPLNSLLPPLCAGGAWDLVLINRTRKDDMMSLPCLLCVTYEAALLPDSPMPVSPMLAWKQQAALTPRAIRKQIPTAIWRSLEVDPFQVLQLMCPQPWLKPGCSLVRFWSRKQIQSHVWASDPHEPR